MRAQTGVGLGDEGGDRWVQRLRVKDIDDAVVIEVLQTGVDGREGS